MTDDRSSAREPESLAAEYALGLLEGDDLRAARERATTDLSFATEVARWRGRLSSLHAETDAVTPPSNLWSRIEASVAPSNDNVPALRRQLRAWKVSAGLMTAIAACLALVLLLEPRGVPLQTQASPQSASPMVALLGDKGAMKVVASWDPNARQLVLAVPGGMSSDATHSHELWVIPAGGKPRSLGTMPDRKQMHMRLANALADLLEQGATIAISVEPRGGSRTGAPTGPVVASGSLTPA